MTSATRTEGGGVEADLEGRGMGEVGVRRRNGWDERIRGSKVVERSGGMEVQDRMIRREGWWRRGKGVNESKISDHLDPKPPAYPRGASSLQLFSCIPLTQII